MFKPTVGNESSHENSNNNGVSVVNFATSKKSTRVIQNLMAILVLYSTTNSLVNMCVMYERSDCCMYQPVCVIYDLFLSVL